MNPLVPQLGAALEARSVLLAVGHPDDLAGLPRAASEKRDYQTQTVDPADFAAACVRAAPSVIVAFVRGVDELKHIAEVKAQRAPHAPVLAVVLSEPEVFLAGGPADADDFLFSPFTALDFGLRLDVLARFRGLRDAIVKSNMRLKALALTDELTGLLKQTEFKRRLDVEVRRIRRFRIPVACVFFDCDHFKAVNDNHGHEAGSFVLKEIARMVGDNLRETDIVGRYGGDEFVVGMPGCGQFEAEAVAKRLSASVREHEFEFGEARIRVTLSMGVVAATPRVPRTTTELLEYADQALYEAKRRGRDQVVVFGVEAEASLPA